MPKEFLISGETYTKLALEIRIRHILHDSAIGVELSGDDEKFMMSVMRFHPQAEKKIGSGARAIRVTTSKYGNRCFELMRTDGTSCEFSYLKCVVNKKESARS